MFWYSAFSEWEFKPCLCLTTRIRAWMVGNRCISTVQAFYFFYYSFLSFLRSGLRMTSNSWKAPCIPAVTDPTVTEIKIWWTQFSICKISFWLIFYTAKNRIWFIKENIVSCKRPLEAAIFIIALPHEWGKLGCGGCWSIITDGSNEKDILCRKMKKGTF